MRVFSLLALVSILLITSCSSDSSDKEIVTEKKDSIVDSIAIQQEIIEPNHALDSLTNLFSKTEVLPFTIEAKNIEKIKLGKKLKSKEVNMLTQSVVKNDLFMDVEYAVEKFNIIDSVKAAGQYEDWKTHLDLGAVKYSEAHCLSQVKTGENSYLLFWVLDYSTVEACPYSYSKTIDATAVYKNKIAETIIFAEQSGGGDAPISFDKKLSGTINSALLMVLSLREELDQDEPKIEVTEGNYEIELKEGKFIFKKEEKKKPVFVKKKKQA